MGLSNHLIEPYTFEVQYMIQTKERRKLFFYYCRYYIKTDRSECKNRTIHKYNYIKTDRSECKNSTIHKYNYIKTDNYIKTWHDSSKKPIWKLSKTFELIGDISRQPSIKYILLKTVTTKLTYSWDLQILRIWKNIKISNAKWSHF